MLRTRATVVLILIASLAVPGAAVAAPWRLDPSFGHDGRLVSDGYEWQSPQGAAPDGAGGLFVWSGLALARVTDAGRAATGFGAAGGTRALDGTVRALRWGPGRLLVTERRSVRPNPRDRVRIFDRGGRTVSERAAAAFGTALERTDHPTIHHHLLATPNHHALVDFAVRGERNLVRVVHDDGRAEPWHVVTWPSALPLKTSATHVVLSGGRILTVAGGGASPRVLAAVTPAGRLDRSWGARGLARLREPVRQLLAWRGGAIAISTKSTTWFDRRGRVVGRRALRAGVAAVDAFGRLLVVRVSADYDSASVLRLDAHRRVDARFGRHMLRGGGSFLPIVVVPDGRHRVTVLARGTLSPEDEWDIREDFDDAYVVHGTLMWRMTDR